MTFKNIWVWIIIVFAIVYVLLFLPSSLPRVFGTQQEKVNICHATSSQSNPWNAIEINASALQTHLNHGDFLYNGLLKQNGKPANDGDEWCEENEPEEPEITPTSTPVPTATPTIEPSCEELENCEPTPTIPEPTSSPSATPTPTKVVEQPTQSSGILSEASAPSCPDTKPGNVANIFVKTTENSGELKVQWSLPTNADQVHIEYGLEQVAQYALLNTPNDGNEVIRSLTSGSHYWFRVSGVNGCAVGESSNWFDPIVP